MRKDLGNDAGKIACNADLGNGNEVEVDFQETKGLWVAAGPGVDAADLWIKGKDNLPDLRIGISRTLSGIQIIVDRGNQDGDWWSAEAAPRMIVAVDTTLRVAAVVASVGEDSTFQEVLLGQTKI